MEKKIFEGMDEEGIRQMRQRDARRLQVMEEYCRITSCLRNYILRILGKKRTAHAKTAETAIRSMRQSI